MEFPKRPFDLLHKEIIGCSLCPRLVFFREHVPPRKGLEHEVYWRKPIPGFGDLKAWLLVLGLAPAPNGGNRTGRVFTGDKTGDFLISSLYEAGFANQPISLDKEDGLIFKGCYLTAAVKCVPPDNRPTAKECLTCSRYLQQEFILLKNLTHILTLGKFAFDSLSLIANKKIGAFKHGGVYKTEGFPTVFSSYHPTPRNVNTGTLTKKMFDKVLHDLKKDHQI